MFGCCSAKERREKRPVAQQQQPTPEPPSPVEPPPPQEAEEEVPQPKLSEMPPAEEAVPPAHAADPGPLKPTDTTAGPVVDDAEAARLANLQKRFAVAKKQHGEEGDELAAEEGARVAGLKKRFEAAKKQLGTSPAEAQEKEEAAQQQERDSEQKEEPNGEDGSAAPLSKIAAAELKEDVDALEGDLDQLEKDVGGALPDPTAPWAAGDECEACYPPDSCYYPARIIAIASGEAAAQGSSTGCTVEWLGAAGMNEEYGHHELTLAALRPKPTAAQARTAASFCHDAAYPVVVIDLGASSTRVGFAGGSGGGLPLCTFPTVVAHPPSESAGDSGGLRLPSGNDITPAAATAADAAFEAEHGVAVGDAALATRHRGGRAQQQQQYQWHLSRPIERGVVSNWRDLEACWRYAFFRLGERYQDEPFQDGNCHPVVLTEPPLQTQRARERVAQFMLEEIAAAALFIVAAPTLALLASGRTTGVVLDSGTSTTSASVVYEGHLIPHATVHIELGGAQITDYLVNLCAEQGYLFSHHATEREIAVDIKHMHAACRPMAQVTEKEEEEAEEEEIKYECDEGISVTHNGAVSTVVRLRDQHLRCTEPLFHPALLSISSPYRQVGPDEDDSKGGSSPAPAAAAALDDGGHSLGAAHGAAGRTASSRSGGGCQALITTAIARVASSWTCGASELYRNIVLAGGNTLFPGFMERLHAELVALYPRHAADGPEEKEKQGEESERGRMPAIELYSGIAFRDLQKYPLTTEEDAAEETKALVHHHHSQSSRRGRRAQPDRVAAAWVGGALLADEKVGRHLAMRWVSKPEYDADGLTVVHRKLFAG